MTRAELKTAFLSHPYLRPLSDAMDVIKGDEINPEKAFDKMMEMAFNDQTLTTGYLEQMQNDDFSAATIDERFGVYLRNCLREDLGLAMEA